MGEGLPFFHLSEKFFWRSSGNSENEERSQTGCLELSHSALKEPLLTPSLSLGRRSNPLEQSAPGTCAKTLAGSSLSPLPLPSYKDFFDTPFAGQMQVSQKLHCHRTNSQTQSS